MTVEFQFSPMEPAFILPLVFGVSQKWVIIPRREWKLFFKKRWWIIRYFRDDPGIGPFETFEEASVFANVMYS